MVYYYEVNQGNYDLTRDGEKRECVISEYTYSSIYELAVRGYGHALYTKYKIDDALSKLLSKEPFYEGLFPLGKQKYFPQDNIIDHQQEIVKKLRAVADEHFAKTKIKD